MDQIPRISPGSIADSPYGLQVAQRIQYAVTQVINSHSGFPEVEVARVLHERIRGLGVNPNAREVKHLAEVIAALPKRG